MSNYDEIFYTETEQDEDYDYAAMQAAEAILNGTIPSTPETYAMVAEWYKPGKARAACVVAKEKHGCNICGYYESDRRSCTSKYESKGLEQRTAKTETTIRA